MICLAISPHLDDAILCAGGYLAQHRDDGARVVVVTIFAGHPPPGPLSELATEFHHDCGLGPDTVEVRRREDAIATAVLGAEPWWLDLPDAIYRQHEGRPGYPSPNELFGTPVPQERDLWSEPVSRIAARFPRVDDLLIPLALGGHVDHRHARRIGEELLPAVQPVRPRWYEESTYEAQHGPTAWAGLDVTGLERGEFLLPAPVRARKFEALAAYRSQLPMLRTATSNGQAKTDLNTVLGSEHLWSPT